MGQKKEYYLYHQKQWEFVYLFLVCILIKCYNPPPGEKKKLFAFTLYTISNASIRSLIIMLHAIRNNAMLAESLGKEKL